MNRQERRDLMKQGASKETVDKVGALASPCTIAECVQISRASAEDVVSDYHRSQGNVQIAMSLQIEILKDIVLSAGLITEEEFKVKYMERAEQIQKMQQDMMKESKGVDVTASMDMEAGDIDIKVEK